MSERQPADDQTGSDTTSNQINDGMFFGPVIMGRDITIGAAPRPQSFSYDASRLEEQEFEYLTTALVGAVSSAKITSFRTSAFSIGGLQADNSRRIDWTDAHAGASGTWWGTTVIKPLFSRPSADAEEDLRKLLERLKTDLERWPGQVPRDLTVDGVNMLVVTSLPVPETVRALIHDLLSALEPPLDAYQLWDWATIQTLLNQHSSVRFAFGGYLAEGDVLAGMDAWMGRDGNSLGKALLLHAGSELIAQQYVRLGQAGDPREDKLSLGDIAIDLPARIGSVSGGKSSESVEDQAIAEIIRRGERIGTYGLAAGEPPHLLVIGDSGQGKSTLAQILCQAYRATLLRHSMLGTEVQRVMTRLVHHFDDIRLQLPSCRRWPVRIVLNDYGDYLAENPDGSLLRYLSKRISAATFEDITSSDLGDWLGTWPWLLVFDGMDEVASPSLRERVSTTIGNFLMEVAQAGADVFIVITTRPQGYTGEFGSEEYRYIELRDLSPAQAMAYARRLTAVRLAEDPELRQRLDERLRDAAQNPDTARMMRTPLQVTIMTLLLERRQRIPADRYQLFNAYFETIYAREANKPTDLGRLLDEQRADIEAVHESVALELQQKAETMTGSEDVLPAADLRRHVLERLVGEGNDDDRAAILAEHIVTAATYRLVLLVPRGDNGVGFEIRSLQEYLAARALSRGEAGQIFNRLRPLVPSVHWRNTWLLAAGRIFREREELRAQLINTLQEADNEGMLSWLVRPGAQLACDLLADDLAVKSPQYRRLLSDQALDLLSGLPDPNWPNLAELLLRLSEEDALTRQKIEKRVQTSLASGGGPRAHANLMLRPWSTGGLGLGVTARRLQDTQQAQLEAGDYGVLLLQGTHHGTQTNALESGPELADYLIDRLPNTEPGVKDGLLNLAKAVPKTTLITIPQEGQLPALVVNNRPQIEDFGLLDTVLSRRTLADAFAQLVEGIPADHWHVAAYLRDIARLWYARRPAGLGAKLP